MKLTERMRELIQACFSGIWIESHEHSDAIAELSALCREHDWELMAWNVSQGLRRGGNHAEESASDPLTALRSLSAGGATEKPRLLVLENFHRFLGSPEIIQEVATAVLSGKIDRGFIVILSPTVQLPLELEKLFVVVEHQLPDRSQLLEIADGIATESGEMPSGTERDLVIDAATGLTRLEAENAFSLSLVRYSKLEPSAIWELKTQMLKKTGTLALHRGMESFEHLGGLDSLKSFTKRSLLRRSDVNGPRPKGALLLSPPGCGKSAFCKALGREVGRPVVVLDVGSLLGSLVGQSEERTRAALRTIDALAPCVCMIDEVEKAFAGMASQNDSGVSARMFGTFLSWLNDHQSDVYVVCTANDVQSLPPEFSRAERFDGVFFLDLPGRPQKDAIWSLYRSQFRLPHDQPLPDDEGWTGAEIKACCRLSALLDLPLSQAALNVVPVSKTSAESVERLRMWADGRCLSADSPGVFQLSNNKPKRRRNVTAKPSVN
ncbi:AAA family ATPase [Rhodopirellula sp. MGV]|uniref:AAA family ATPase n=1 Tax=Rhodopirellula sp. MGV TaxID=2023130 RepID=UPI000B9667F9|nr:AAA family ATPase [Rhodopirellula sp. MGV]OYP33983.1 AAA family ATPase [Rhodopirellula sp. MGV]PNY37262.1 AAA family ATPase [Rhodopirellula baltica]